MRFNLLNINVFLLQIKRYNLVSVQSSRSTRLNPHLSSTTRLHTSCSLKITNRSFRYAASYLWSQAHGSFHESHPHLCVVHSLITLIVPDYRFHHLSLLSFTRDSKHALSTIHFHHSLPIVYISASHTDHQAHARSLLPPSPLLPSIRRSS